MTALTAMKMAGHWDEWLETYSRATYPLQHSRYYVMRHKYYMHMYGIDPNWANKKGL